jgi:PAS domain S-box-containing protein
MTGMEYKKRPSCPERRLEEIVEAVPAGIFTVDVEARITSWNKAAEEITGYERREVLGKPCVFESSPQCGGMCPVLSTMEPVLSGEYEVVTKKGEKRVLRKGARLLRDPEGEVVGVVESFIDVTEKRRLEEEVERRGEFLKTVFESIPHPLYVIDAESYAVLMANTAASPQGRWRGKTCYELTHLRKTPCRGGHPCPLEMVKKDKKPVVVEHVHYDREGMPRSVEVHGYPVFDKEGGIVQMIEYAMDVTERKRAEEALKKAYDELKSMDELKSNIISNVSHELRTPITVIKAALELARFEEDPEERNRLLGIALEAIRRQDRIVENLVEAARMERTERELNLEELDLSQVVTLVAAEFKPLAVKKGLEMRVEVEEDLLVMGDYTYLVTALRNLLDNAVKFNRKGGRIVVTARRRDREAVVCVSDTGIGIPGDKLEKVFDRFYQVDSSTSRSYGGMGMGLAVVKEIVEAHGGRIWVKSKPHRGSKFYFSLPLK